MGTRGKRKVAPHKVRKIVGATVKQWMSDKTISADQLAKNTKMDRRTINRLVNGEVSTTLDNIGHLADALGAEVLVLFVKREPMLAGSELPLQGEVVTHVTVEKNRKRRDKSRTP